MGKNNFIRNFEPAGPQNDRDSIDFCSGKPQAGKLMIPACLFKWIHPAINGGSSTAGT
jgi:hypothetical protein